jgi:hypothetical protein
MNLTVVWVAEPGVVGGVASIAPDEPRERRESLRNLITGV